MYQEFCVWSGFEYDYYVCEIRDYSLSICSVVFPIFLVGSSKTEDGLIMKPL